MWTAVDFAAIDREVDRAPVEIQGAVRTVLRELVARSRWKDGEVGGEILKRGQCRGSRDGIAAATGVTSKRVRRALEWLEEGQNRAIERADKRARIGSVITLLRYDTYSPPHETEGQSVGRQGARERARTGPRTHIDTESTGSTAVPESSDSADKPARKRDTYIDECRQAWPTIAGSKDGKVPTPAFFNKLKGAHGSALVLEILRRLEAKALAGEMVVGKPAAYFVAAVEAEAKQRATGQRDLLADQPAGLAYRGPEEWRKDADAP